jgi:hypothetical protein
MADRVIEVLDEEQCLNLMSPGGIGRIAYISRYGPTGAAGELLAD